MRYLLVAILAIFATQAAAPVLVKPYVKKDGTFVTPHARAKANATKLDNFGKTKRRVKHAK